jgi:hypothetical protein
MGAAMYQGLRNWVGGKVKPLFWRTMISGLVLGAGAWSVYEVNRAITAKNAATKAVKKVRSSSEFDPTATSEQPDLSNAAPILEGSPGGSWQGGNEIAQVANNEASPAASPRRALLAPPSRALGSPAPMPREMPEATTVNDSSSNPYRGARGGGYQINDDAIPVETGIPAEPDAAPSDVLPSEPNDAAAKFSSRFQQPASDPPSTEPPAPALSTRRGGSRFQPMLEQPVEQPAA